MYFVSDLHLGYDHSLHSLEREKVFINWLKAIELNCKALYLVGDTFDYWFEYRSVVPKGYVRLLSQLADWAESGIAVHFLKGNHDMWVADYFSKELQFVVHQDLVDTTIDGKRFLILHGDGLGKGDWLYKITKSIFRNSFCQRLFSMIHPSIGLSVMKAYSKMSRERGDHKPDVSKLSDQIEYCENQLINSHFDFFIMGHYHYAHQARLSNGTSTYINLGDWVHQFSYGVWNGSEFKLDRINPSLNSQPESQH